MQLIYEVEEAPFKKFPRTFQREAEAEIPGRWLKMKTDVSAHKPLHPSSMTTVTLWLLYKYLYPGSYITVIYLRGQRPDVNFITYNT